MHLHYAQYKMMDPCMSETQFRNLGRKEGIITNEVHKLFAFESAKIRGTWQWIPRERFPS